MQFRVVIPENVKSGQLIRIVCPDGTEADVTVPKGAKAGDAFVFDLPVDQLNNPKVLLDSLQSTPDAAPGKKGFLDREITSLQDLALALSVGLLIGMGIVLGFLAGILYVTGDVADSPPQLQAPPHPPFQEMPQVVTNPGTSEW